MYGIEFAHTESGDPKGKKSTKIASSTDFVNATPSTGKIYTFFLGQKQI